MVQIHTQQQRIIRRQQGFTAIELMVIVAVLGILAAIAIPNFLGVQEKAKPVSVRGNLRTTQISQESFMTDVGPSVLPETPAATPAPSAAPLSRSTDGGMSSRFAHPPILPGITGEYEIDQTGDTRSVNIRFTPTMQAAADKHINGLELPLTQQSPPLPEKPSDSIMTTNGRKYYDPKNWACALKTAEGGSVLRCAGSEPLVLNKPSTFDVFFKDDVSPMDPLYVHFLNGDTVVGSFNPIRQVSLNDSFTR